MSARRERLAVMGLVVALVLLRCFVPTYYEGYYFDSDQAIVGLMAKHLSAGQHVPIFFYGQNYLLAVQAWIAAPLFRIARPSVALLRLPFVVLNVVAAVWLVLALARRLSLRPWLALVAALPFVIPTPATAGQLLDMSGACVEPFLYVLLLWQLRRRPVWFGALLALAFLHREFTIVAVPALALVEMRRRDFWSLASLRRGAWILFGFALFWLVVDDVRMHLTAEPLALQAASLANQICLDAAALRSHTLALVTQALPELYGGRRLALVSIRMNTAFAGGFAVVGLLVAATLGLVAGRLATLPEPEDGEDARFGTYLAWLGLLIAAVYPLSCAVVLNGAPLLRYLLLALLLPVGLGATFLRRERSRTLRAAVVAAFVVWAGVNLTQNLQLIRQSIADPPDSEHRALVNYLLANQIHYARAIYWDAYVIDFLSRERVIAASSDIVRIPEYQEQVGQHANEAVFLERVPCRGGERIASWCVRRN